MIPRPSRLVLLGQPVAHSLSPTFQNAALRISGVPLIYEAVETAPAELSSVLASLHASRAAGNITLPHKEATLSCCDTLTLLARRVGAVNTFWVDASGRLVGDNTDVDGFDAMARSVLGANSSVSRVTVLGAGGGAAAVLAALERWPNVVVTLVNRSPTRGARLAARFPVVRAVVPSAEEGVRGADVLVNATAVGLDGAASPVILEALEAHTAILDLVYRRGGTPLVSSAVASGRRASDGLPMLIEQGALAFERWLGIPAPREAMWESLA